MGVEYQHYLIPEDPNIEFSDEQVISIITVLRDYGIWGDIAKPKYLAGSGKESFEKTKDGCIYHDEVSGSQVAKVFGASSYDGVSDEDRYIQGVYVVHGESKKIHTSSEEVEVIIEGIDLVEVDFDFQNVPFYEFTALEISSSNVELIINNSSIEDYSWFKGWWKSAVMFDFGKDVPAWSEKASMENDALKVDIEKATGILFREIGNHY